MKLTKSKIVYNGKFIKVKINEFEDNGKIYSRELIESGEGVLIIALTGDNSMVLIKQHRSNHGEIYEVPAGAINVGETPLKAAKRELAEEAGLKAKTWQLLSKHHNGVHEEGYNFIFLAKELSHTTTNMDNDEVIAPHEIVSIQKALELIKKNRVVDLRNRACVWLAKVVTS